MATTWSETVYSYGPIGGYLCALDPNKSSKMTPSGKIVPENCVWVIWPMEPRGWARRERVTHFTREHCIEIRTEQASQLAEATGAPFS